MHYGASGSTNIFALYNSQGILESNPSLHPAVTQEYFQKRSLRSKAVYRFRVGTHIMHHHDSDSEALGSDVVQPNEPLLGPRNAFDDLTVTFVNYEYR